MKLLGWCLMTNHVQLVAIPGRTDSLSVLFRRVHGRYGQYFNARVGRSGHLWQNRFFACPLGRSHLWSALAYVERNPVRAGLLERAEEYRWSSALAHVSGRDEFGILDMDWWVLQARHDWSAHLAIEEPPETTALRSCTHSGRPFGDEAFVAELGKRFGRQWVRGRPRNDGKLPRSGEDIDAEEAERQFALFSNEQK